MIVRPQPPIAVTCPAGPGEAVAYLGDTAVVRLHSGALHLFPTSAVHPQEDFPAETGVQAKSEINLTADPPIRRGDVVTWGGTGDVAYRVTDVSPASDAAVILQDGTVGPSRTVHLSHLKRSVPLKCPGHVVGILTRRCITCGLSDSAIYSAGEKYRVEGQVEETPPRIAKSPEKTQIPAWAEEIYQVLLTKPQTMLRVLVGDPDAEPYVRVVPVSEFCAAFGFER